jgi:membrane-associated phospholipid phosphatase
MAHKPLRAAAGVAAAALAALAAIAWVVFGSAGGAGADREALNWIRAHTPAVALQWLAAVSDLHRPRGIVAATAVALALLLWRRERIAALWLLCVVAGGAALNDALKHAVQRARPGEAALALAKTDFSFPSGHAANSTLLYGALALLFISRVPSRALRGLLWSTVVAVVATVAASRLVLGAHYPSDVLAGAALAIAWLALCVVALRRWQPPARDG